MKPQTCKRSPAVRIGCWKTFVGHAVFAIGILAWLSGPCRGAEASSQGGNSSDLTEWSLEKLLDTTVTTVSKKAERVSDAAAAIHVITQDDIRRSGVTSIPEALRMAPGVHVGRVDSHTWAISARGFNDVFANKLLVLMDGRSVYTPLFSGVYWDAQDTVLEDIDRIEVIRGPGATLWGANAVNGVINIITKKAQDTQGFLLSGGGGTEERGFGSVRYGAKISDDAFLRVYGKYFNRDDSVLPNGHDANDSWEKAQGGFRMDWEMNDINSLTLQGDIYGGKLDQTSSRPMLVPPFRFSNVDRIDVAGGNVLGRWTHRFSADSDLSLQMYYDRTMRDLDAFRENRDTLDLDLQHRFPLGSRQSLIWGMGYRVTDDDVRNSFDIALDPNGRSLQLFSLFAQDEITLVPDRLVLTIGSKLEHNDLTGFEVQPSGRLAWKPHKRHTVWTSISRAVRTPSRAEADLRLNAGVLPPGAVVPGASTITSVFGSDHYKSEDLVAYELGYRVQPHDRLSLDLATFYNDYDSLRSISTGSLFFEGSPPPPHFVIPFVVGNDLSGETYGAELAANLQLTDWWRWSASYTYLQMQLHPETTPSDSGTERSIERSNPHHQFSLHSSMDLWHNVELDVAARYVDSIARFGIGSYTTMDVRVGWRPTRNLEFSVVGQNLLDHQHAEFSPTTVATEFTEVQRSVYAKVTWRF